MVFLQDQHTICDVSEGCWSEDIEDPSNNAGMEDVISHENFESYKEDYPDKILEEDKTTENPEAESDIINHSKVDAQTNTFEQVKADAEHNESTEADRMQLVKERSKRIIKKQTSKLRKAVDGRAADMSVIEVKGRWINVSD